MLTPLREERVADAERALSRTAARVDSAARVRPHATRVRPEALLAAAMLCEAATPRRQRLSRAQPMRSPAESPPCHARAPHAVLQQRQQRDAELTCLSQPRSHHDKRLSHNRPPSCAERSVCRASRECAAAAVRKSTRTRTDARYDAASAERKRCFC